MRTFLVLARVSNLPTVWSNCLAAWMLSGCAFSGRFALVCLGASLLYTGGMFLNDAFDQNFDRRYRPERPIVSGLISPRAVWALSFGLLASGLILFISLGSRPATAASLLTGTIVLYNWVHKRAVLAPLVMAACRFLVYVLTAVAAVNQLAPAVLWRAAALFGYIVGLSYLARGESTGARFWRGTIPLLFGPALVAHFRPLTGPRLMLEFVAVLQVAWTAWSLCITKPTWLTWAPQGVAALLAGIVLVDWLAVASVASPWPFLFLFALAVLLQRIAPAS
jgi:4-hydroxybenzoate polyprenyltransferase